MELSFLSLNLNSISCSTSRPRFTICNISSNNRNIRTTIKIKQELAATDTRIDFGRYKGKMLGTLPSPYLKWVSKNLRASDTEYWAKLADQVLSDPVYKDRIEWEFAQNLLDGNNSNVNGRVSDLLGEVSERFGWDNDDKLGWSRIDFDLLGTSKGGRIPRTSTRRSTKVSVSTGEVSRVKKRDVNEESSKKRLERRERLRMKRISGEIGLRGVDKDSEDEHEKDNPSISTKSPFPGRESLFRLNNRR